MSIKHPPAPILPSPPPSKWRRAFYAHPFVLLSIFGYLSMDIAGMMKLPRPSRSGKIEWEGGSVDILQKFHSWPLVGPILDEVFKDVTCGFAPSSFGIDDQSWWQMITFLSDISVVHMIWMLEASRGEGTRVAWLAPGLWQFIAQLGGGGIIYPLYYFLLYTFSLRLPLATTPSSKGEKTSPRPSLRIDINAALFPYLFGMLFLHILPISMMYFAPTLESRHWWTWFWQIYSVRISIGYYIFKFLQRVLNFRPINTENLPTHYDAGIRSYHGIIILIVFSLALFSCAAWSYTTKMSGYSIYTLFWPAQLGPGERSFEALLRRILQYDQWLAMGSSLLWVGYLGWDMFAAGAMDGVQLLKMYMFVPLLPALGPGMTFGGMWLIRESCLVQ